MLKNKIMVLAIGLLTYGGAVNSQTLRSDNGPAEIPPASFKGKQYVDSRGCVYIKAGFGTRVTWVPRVNRQRKVFCSKQNKPSLSPTQLAKISGKPATRVVKPVEKTPIVKKPAPTAKVVKAAPAVVKKVPRAVASVPPKATPVVPQKINRIPKRRKNGLFGNRPKTVQNPAPAKIVRTVPVEKTPVATTTVVRTANNKGVRRGPQAIHPSDVIRQSGPVIQGGTDYNIASSTYEPVTPVIQGGTAYNIEGTGQNARQASSVRGVSNSARRNRRNEMRDGPQAIHPADVIAPRSASGGNQQLAVLNNRTAAARGVDPIHGLTIYNSVIKSDVTPRGDAQMALVWTNTVPRRLVKRTRAREVPQTNTYIVSTKSQANNVNKATRTQTAASPVARYVQIGTFGNNANAGKTVRRFQTRGFPVSSRVIKRNGQSLKVVFLGPFKTPGAAQSAMRSARGAGFKDAFYVK